MYIKVTRKCTLTFSFVCPTQSRRQVAERWMHITIFTNTRKVEQNESCTTRTRWLNNGSDTAQRLERVSGVRHDLKYLECITFLACVSTCGHLYKSKTEENTRKIRSNSSHCIHPLLGILQLNRLKKFYLRNDHGLSYLFSLWVSCLQ